MDIFSLLPKEILDSLEQNKRNTINEYSSLIRKGGYITPEPEILMDAIAALSLGKNILLKGPTGSGKTRFAETLSNLFNNPLFSVNCSVDLDAESLLGFKTLEYEGEKQLINFISGPIINSMKSGSLLYIDEINMAKPETLSLINGVLDYRRTITNPFTNETVTANNGFNVIAAINEGYIGTTPLNEALKNRFVIIEVPYIQGDSLRNLIKSESKLSNDSLIDSFVKLSADLIKGAEQGLISEDAASIRALLDACDLSTLISPNRAVLRSITDKLDEPREKEFVKNISELLF